MNLRRHLTRRAFNLDRRAAFYTDMAAFMDAGIPPYRAIQQMEANARRSRRTARLANCYRAMLPVAEGGKNLAVAISQWVPGGEGVMLVGAEKAGSDVLLRAFRELGTLLDRQQQARAKLFRALFNNLVALAAIVGVMAFVMVMVVPELSKGVTPDMEGRMKFAPYYFAFGRFFLHYGLAVGLIIVAIVALSAWSFPNWWRNRRWWSRRWFDHHVLPWQLYLRMQTTFFLSATSAMMRAGRPLKAVASDMQPHTTPWMRRHLARLLNDLEGGSREVDALGASAMLPVDTADRLRVYKLMPDFTGIMSRLSEDNFKAFETSIDRLSRTLGLVSLLLLALFAASTMIATFDFSAALNASVSAMRSAAGG